MSQNKEQNPVTEEKKYTTVVVEGTVTEARYGKSRFNDTEKYRISIKSDAIPYDQIHAFDTSGSKLTPGWFKDKNGYINLSSIYEIHVKNTKGVQIDFEDWITDYNALGATVKISIIQKDGAVYPKAIKVLADGEARDPFEDL